MNENVLGNDFRLPAYISNTSLLNRGELVLGLLTGRWPSCDQLHSRAEELGAEGMQVTMLRGWSAEEVALSSKSMPVLTCPWYGRSITPGYISRMLFGSNAYRNTDEVFLRRLAAYSLEKFITIDYGQRKDPETLITVSGESGKQSLYWQKERSFEPVWFAYNTWSARAGLPGYDKEAWDFPAWARIFGDVPGNIAFYEDISLSLRRNVSDAIFKQLDLLREQISVYQIETWSAEEASRFIAGDPTILTVQVGHIARNLKLLREDGVERLPLVVIAMPPWWSMGFKRRFVHAVRLALDPIKVEPYPAMH